MREWTDGKSYGVNHKGQLVVAEDKSLIYNPSTGYILGINFSIGDIKAAWGEASGTLSAQNAITYKEGDEDSWTYIVTGDNVDPIPAPYEP